MAAAALVETFHLARRDGLGEAHRLATAAASAALRPGPLRPRAAHPPLWEPGEPARRAPAGTNFVRAPSRLPRRAHSPRHRLTRPLMLSAVGTARRPRLSSQSCPQYWAVPGGQHLSQPSPLAPAVYLSQPDGAVRGSRRAGEAPGALGPTKPAAGQQVCSQGHRLLSAALGATPSLPSPTPPRPCFPGPLPFCISAWLLSTPCALAGLFCI